MQDQLLRLWPTEDDARECIRHEAETVDEAVFLAVHQPMQFLRRPVGAARGVGEPRSEQDLLDEFLTPHLPEGRLIMPIVGSSGVGKSHVIRWLDAQLRRRPDAGSRHVIRIPKGTSLKGVLRILLDRIDGPGYDGFREALTKARDHLDPAKAAKQLRLNLRDRLEKEARAAAQRIREGSAKPLDKLVRGYGDRRALPLLLGDTEIEYRHWLETPDGKPGVIARLAEQVTTAAATPEDDRKSEFSRQDLELAPEIVAMLHPNTAKFYNQLRGGATDRVAEAVQVLNLALDPAKEDLLELGDGSLSTLFNEVRAQLLKDGKELVLLVEDLAVLSGMQGALMQVMITEAVRTGKQELCAIRSAMAYTEGYANVPETVLTRARSQWLIEDVPGNEDAILERVERLVGSYLNAARAGRERLEELRAGAAPGAAWIPRVTGGPWEPEEARTIDAFGTSGDGYPLFPFNRAAIRELTLRGSTNSQGELVFNPRNVINHVLSEVLPFRATFAAGQFPTVEFGARDLRSTAVIGQVRRLVPASERNRTLSLLRYWGGQPETESEAARLPEVVYQAFGLQRPRWGASPAPPDLPKSPRPVAETAPPKPPPSRPTMHPVEREWLDRLEQWGAAGRVLEQRAANTLRGWIVEAMLQSLRWTALLRENHHGRTDLVKQVFLPQARGSGVTTQETAFLVVAKPEDLDDPAARADCVANLMAFVRLHAVHKSWDYDGAEVDAARYAEFLAAREAQAERYLARRHHRKQGDALPSLVEGLLVGARALGVPGGESRSEASRVAALFAEPEQAPVDGESGWARARSLLFRHRPAMRSLLLSEVGARQAKGGKVHAVDVARLLPLVEATARAWRLDAKLPEGPDPQLQEVRNALRELRRSLPGALQKERTALVAWHTEAVAWFGDDPDKEALRQALLAMVTAAKAVGILNYDYEALRRRIHALKDLPLKAALKDCQRLSETEEPGTVLAILSRDPSGTVAIANELTLAVDAFLQRHSKEVDARIQAIGDDVYQAQVDEVREELGRLRALLTGPEEVSA